jgi:hypothetical protein
MSTAELRAAIRRQNRLLLEAAAVG